MNTSVKRVLKTAALLRWIDRAATAVEIADPSLRLALRYIPAPPRLALVAVYRHKNAHHVSRLIATLPPGSRVALWALDAVAFELAAHTVGVGPQARFVLLNRCSASLGTLDEHEWLIASDDDVALTRGSISDAVRIASAAGLDLSQPGHAWKSNINWGYTRRRAMIVARRGQFVEIGPLLIMSPRGRRLVLPFPEGAGMGWGTEACWARLQERGLRLGIVDAVLMTHLHPMGTSYKPDDERHHERRILAMHGLESLESLQTNGSRWYSWQRPRPLTQCKK